MSQLATPILTNRDKNDTETTSPNARDHVAALYRDPNEFWLVNQWYVAMPASKLGKKPLRKTIMDVPLVFYRGKDNRAVCLLDACGHRKAPLSAGRVVDGCIQCPYHGWRYGADGTCQTVPALPEKPKPGVGRIPSFPVQEKDGLIWVFMKGDETAEPETDAPAFPCSQHAWSAHFHYDFSFNGDLIGILENLLDYTHTSFVHHGNFRDLPEDKVRIAIRRNPDHVDFDFLDEKVAGGLLFRLMAKSGNPMGHIDRFKLPSIAETIYTFGPDYGFTFYEALTPENSMKTNVFGCFTVRLPFPFPRFILETYLKWEGWRLYREDTWILDLVRDNLKEVNDHRMASTKADMYRPNIANLIRQAKRGIKDREPDEKIIELLV